MAYGGAASASAKATSGVNGNKSASAANQPGSINGPIIIIGIQQLKAKTGRKA